MTMTAPKLPTLAPPRRARRSIWTRAHALALFEVGLLVGQVLLLAVSFVWPFSPASQVVLAVLTALALPWGWLVLGGGLKPERTALKVWVFRLVLCGLVVTFLGLKWALKASLGDGDPGALVNASRSYTVALLLLLPLGLLAKELRFAKVGTLIADHPARLMAVSFAGTGLMGGLLLSLPPAMQRVNELSILDNMFMAFSAVCVTGLTVNAIAQTYTLFGQILLLLLVQIGGLGIMVLSAAVGLLAGRRLRVKSTAVLAEMVDTESLASLRRVVVAIVATTLIIEAAGAVFLYFRFLQYPELLLRDEPALQWGPHPAWAAIFHAVSGFCQAGFSNLHPGLLPLVGDGGVMACMSSLIVLGGIGFPVIHELSRRVPAWIRRQRLERLSLHTRVCLHITALLLGVVSLAYLLLEWRGAFQRLPWADRLAAAVFHGVSCRTAGFNVVDVGLMQPATLMLTCMAMFIGACPGSCGGGIKVTTFATLYAGLRSELEGKPAYLLDRTLPANTIRKAIGVAFMSIGLLSLSMFFLFLVERHDPLALAFEAFSAFTTTGLSVGITPELSPTGKLVVLLTMYIGRIGPLTLALALSRRMETVAVHLPEERVLIG